MRKLRIFSLIILLTLVALCGADPVQKVEAATTKLEVHYIDVGQGDCTLIKYGSHAMLIDSGDNNCGTNIQNYLRKQNVKSLDYFVITHTDADHAGGADVVITKFDIGKVIYPDMDSETATWRDVKSAMEYKRYKRTDPKVGEVYKLGKAKFTIIGPQTFQGVTDNDSSVALRLVYDKTSFLFVGDSEDAAEETMLKQKIKSTVYMASHHGSKNGTNEVFLKKVNPKYVVISCGENNQYGHPHSFVLNMLREMGIKVYRTDEQGSVIATSNGKKVTFNCSPSTSWQAGEGSGSSSESSTPPLTTQKDIVSCSYIININTKKFHYPDCGSVKQMSEKNKRSSNSSRDELVKQGYSPCGNCRP